MAVAEPQVFREVAVDGIPVGPGYGVAVERKREYDVPTSVLPRTRLKPAPVVVKWLTIDRGDGTYERFRRLPADVVLTAVDDEGYLWTAS